MPSAVINLFSRNGAASTGGGRAFGAPSPAATNASSVLVEKPDWEDETTDRLRFLLELREGWDGFDARPIDLDSAMFGLKLLNFILPKGARAPKLSPTNYGGLQFEWFNRQCELEIEIEAPYRVKVLFVNNLENKVLEQSFDYEYGLLSDLLRRTLSWEEPEANASAAA